MRMLTAVYAVLVATTPYKSLVSEKSGNSMGLNIARGTTDRVGCFCKIIRAATDIAIILLRFFNNF